MNLSMMRTRESQGRALAIVFALAASGVVVARAALAAEPLAFVLPSGFVDRTSDGAPELAPLFASMGLSGFNVWRDLLLTYSRGHDAS